ncbi:hypothetical protein D5281_12615 [bacterium 1xD42-62]|uniref:Uncharacterized protein n=1 Tax=Parablautia muri TaxID=2320879 RepID=A0A9X5BIA8_9FIRM|nr:hypothetical protein [Parablautia muri]
MLNEKKLGKGYTNYIKYSLKLLSFTCLKYIEIFANALYNIYGKENKYAGQSICMFLYGIRKWWSLNNIVYKNTVLQLY